MNAKVYALLRTFMFVALIPALSMNLVSCEPENGEGNSNGSDEGGFDDTTSEIAVTGLVDVFGCTYADISGYANLNLLPASGSGNPLIGIELVKVDDKNNASFRQEITSSLEGNAFTVSFRDLSPATEYKYRSFVTYGGVTYYCSKYNIFTTKEMVDLISIGEVSNITLTSATISASVQTENIDVKDNIYVGVVWAISASEICLGGEFKSSKIPIQDVGNDVFVASLCELSEGTTYYYASFTEVGGAYLFSSVKDFTTKTLQLQGPVDLGLSVNWAAYNVGAASPGEYGGYYAWGETEEKYNYDWATYKWCNGSWEYITKYCTDNQSGVVDNKTTLEPEDDVAHVKWGDGWRMPTLDETKELHDKCVWEWTSVNGVNGYLVSGNGNSIFLPAAGYREGKTYFNRGSFGFYWLSTLYEGYNDTTYRLFFYDSEYNAMYLSSRCNGYTIRPVREKQ